MIKKLSPLPNFLVNRYKDWKSSSFLENSNKFKKLASLGQNPKTMVISCCDSRIHATSIFGAEEGEFFIHRNIANLIPPFNPSGDHHGTSAAIEYASMKLKIPHIIVLGHFSCGGINAGYHIYCNSIKNEEYFFVNKWLSILKPAYDNLPSNKPEDERISLLAEESIKVSINNLINFPSIKRALKNDSLTIHGLIHDIGLGKLKTLNPLNEQFEDL